MTFHGLLIFDSPKTPQHPHSGVGWVNFFLAQNESSIYPNMCAKFGCGPTVMSKKRGVQTDRQTKKTAALYSRFRFGINQFIQCPSNVNILYWLSKYPDTLHIQLSPSYKATTSARLKWPYKAGGLCRGGQLSPSSHPCNHCLLRQEICRVMSEKTVQFHQH